MSQITKVYPSIVLVLVKKHPLKGRNGAGWTVACLAPSFDSIHTKSNALTSELTKLTVTTHWAIRHAVIMVIKPTPIRKLRLQSAQVRIHRTTDLIVR